MKYTYEFKRQVVNDYLAKRGGVQALAKAYGIPAKSLVRQWIKAYQELGDEGLMPSPSKKNEDHGRISCYHDFSFTKERKIITINRDNKQGYEGEALD